MTRPLLHWPNCLFVIALLTGVGFAHGQPAPPPGPAEPAATATMLPEPPPPALTPPEVGDVLRGAGVINPTLLDAEVDRFIRIEPARARFRVTGQNLTVAVIDTGANPRHVDFRGKLIPGRNFSSQGPAEDTTDYNGHGSNVAGIIAGNPVELGGRHVGIAPSARIVPLKVFPGGEFARINMALQWVIDHRDQHNISVVNMSLGSDENLASVAALAPANGALHPDIARQRQLIAQLRQMNVAVVVAAGNSYSKFLSAQGMAFPAICPETVSVGAVYDTVIPPRADGAELVTYRDGSRVMFTEPGRCTTFTQRLGPSRDSAARTDVFAPGFIVTSTGPALADPQADSSATETTQDGTSQAGPVVAGVVLLLQERYAALTRSIGAANAANRLPPVQLIEECLRAGVPFTDVEDGTASRMDNVTGSGEQFIRLDAVAALDHLEGRFRSDVASIQGQLLRTVPADRPALLKSAKILQAPLQADR